MSSDDTDTLARHQKLNIALACCHVFLVPAVKFEIIKFQYATKLIFYQKKKNNKSKHCPGYWLIFPWLNATELLNTSP